MTVPERTYLLRAEYRNGRVETIRRRGGLAWKQKQAALSAAATLTKKGGAALAAVWLVVERRDEAGRLIDVSQCWL